MLKTGKKHKRKKEETDVNSSALLKMSKIFGTDIDYLLKECCGVKAEKVFANMLFQEGGSESAKILQKRLILI